MEGSYFQKRKDCTNDFESFLVIFWAIDVDDVIFEECRRPFKEYLEFFRAPTVLLMECTPYIAKEQSPLGTLFY